MSKHYYVCERNDGSLAEGYYSTIRRIVGRLFLGEKFTKIGSWHE